MKVMPFQLELGMNNLENLLFVLLLETVDVVIIKTPELDPAPFYAWNGDRMLAKVQ
jgi:hypothetical protein